MAVTINGTTGITTPEVVMDNGAADGGQVVLKSSGYSNWNWDNYSGRLRAYYNATEYFTITNTGYVGIGTASPTRKLQSTTTEIWPARFESSNAIATAIEVKNTNTRTWEMAVNGVDGALYFYDQTAGAARLATDANGVFYFNSGYGSAGAAYGCRAWVSFNGTGTTGTNQTIGASANVTSVLKNANGDYTVNFLTAMPDANYAAVVTTQTLTSLTSGGNAMGVIYPAATPKATTSVRVANYQGNAITLLNATNVCVAIFR